MVLNLKERVKTVLWYVRLPFALLIICMLSPILGSIQERIGEAFD